MRHQLDLEIPSKNTKYAVQDPSGLCVQQLVSSGRWRKRFVRHQCRWDSISHRNSWPGQLLSSRGRYHRCLVSGAVTATLLSKQKSGQDNSQGQASEYFECTRKHYEHWDNIIDNHALKNSMITSSVINKTSFMHASRLFICNMNKQ